MATSADERDSNPHSTEPMLYSDRVHAAASPSCGEARSNSPSGDESRRAGIPDVPAGDVLPDRFRPGDTAQGAGPSGDSQQ